MGLVALAVSDLENLFRAWRDVRSHVIHATWQHITSELHELDASPLASLQRIQAALRDGSYRFGKKLGYAKRKSGGSRRGITIHSVRDRIVQRAILNVLFTSDEALRRHLGQIPDVLHHPASFAGIPGRGVPQAVARVLEVLRAGAQAFAYSDMKDFFPCVPRKNVAEFIRRNVPDAAFADLFALAIETELDNPAELEGMLDLFPGLEIGVAQGSLLSVVAGNIAMRRFDEILNASGCVMVRYLDDFVILTDGVSAVRRWFDIARDELASLGMECYLPGDGSQKAFLGKVTDGFDFLGCRIHPDGVSPARRNRQRLLRELQAIIAETKREIRSFKTDAAKRRRTEPSYVQALQRIDRKIRGWGDVYQFVTNRVAFAQMDRTIDQLLGDFQFWFAKQIKGEPPQTRRRMWGVAVLGDTPPRPLTDSE